MTTRSSSTQDFAPYFYSHHTAFLGTEMLMGRAYELRFQTYCLERGFLPAQDYPNRQEKDSYDIHSEHFCAFNHQKDLVGYVRLVRSDERDSFPFQHHRLDLFDSADLPPASESGEISRLIVCQNYRRRRGDNMAGVSTEDVTHKKSATSERRVHSPQILLSLYRQMYACSLKQDIRYWYAAMEPSLARALSQMNFGFRQIGPPADYYGMVAPYVADLRDLEMRIQAKNPDLMDWLRSPETADCH